jgi:hypothetical protein
MTSKVCDKCFDSFAGTRQAKRLRLRLQFPIPAWEKGRIERAVREKLARETGWAKHYHGVPVFMIEESAFGQAATEALRDTLQAQRCFAALIRAVIDRGEPMAARVNKAFLSRPAYLDAVFDILRRAGGNSRGSTTTHGECAAVWSPIDDSAM